MNSSIDDFCCTNLQVRETLLEKCLEVGQTAKDQATDNAILDQLHKVISCTEVATFRLD